MMPTPAITLAPTSSCTLGSTLQLPGLRRFHQLLFYLAGFAYLFKWTPSVRSYLIDAVVSSDLGGIGSDALGSCCSPYGLRRCRVRPLTYSCSCLDGWADNPQKPGTRCTCRLCTGSGARDWDVNSVAAASTSCRLGWPSDWVVFDASWCTGGDAQAGSRPYTDDYSTDYFSEPGGNLDASMLPSPTSPSSLPASSSTLSTPMERATAPFPPSLDARAPRKRPRDKAPPVYNKKRGNQTIGLQVAADGADRIFITFGGSSSYL